MEEGEHTCPGPRNGSRSNKRNLKLHKVSLNYVPGLFAVEGTGWGNPGCSLVTEQKETCRITSYHLACPGGYCGKNPGPRVVKSRLSSGHKLLTMSPG